MISIISALTATLDALTAPLRTRLRADDGLEAVEYALLAALVAASIIAAMAFFTPALETAFNNISQWLAQPGPPPP